MTREEAARILDAVIPPPDHHTVDLDHLRIAQAWAYVKETLTADPKHGRWEDKYGDGDWHCSKCGAIVEKDEQGRHYWARCYHCGAKMDGGGSDGSD